VTLDTGVSIAGLRLGTGKSVESSLGERPTGILRRSRSACSRRCDPSPSGTDLFVFTTCDRAKVIITMLKHPLGTPHELSLARYYRGARSVHLERLATFAPGDFLYFKPMYDFDEALAAKLPSVHQVRFGQVLWRVLRRKYDVLELAEPYTPSALPQNVAITLASHLSALAPGAPTLLVTYAIENADLPAKLAVKTHLPAAFVRLLVKTLVGFCFNRLDRVVFGTQAARDNYSLLLGEQRLAKSSPSQTLIWGLPTKETELRDERPGTRLMFLGALDSRKGIRNLMTVWDAVLQRIPAAELDIVGKGPLEAEVRAWAAKRRSVRFDVDPPRQLIRDRLSGATALFMLSQPSPLWKEQIGLPILEGLGFGLEIVASSETGISRWLAEHGHRVLPPDATDIALVDAIVEALRTNRPPSRVADDLPQLDGRLAADQWLYA
jgi:glycosyltransferase involved in cell wall biosynthesis